MRILILGRFLGGVGLCRVDNRPCQISVTEYGLAGGGARWVRRRLSRNRLSRYVHLHFSAKSYHH